MAFEEVHQPVDHFTGATHNEVPYSQGLYGQAFAHHGPPPAAFNLATQRGSGEYAGHHGQFVHNHDQGQFEAMQMTQSSQHFPAEYQDSVSHVYPGDQSQFVEAPTFSGYHPARAEEGPQMLMSRIDGHGQMPSFPVAGRHVFMPGQVVNPTDENLARLEAGFF
jgi:hypothetical protein